MLLLSRMISNKGLGNFIAGAGLGEALGLLFAPKKGAETRAELKSMFDDLMNKVRSIDAEDVKVAVEAKIEELKVGLENLNKETVLAEAKKQANNLRSQAEDLVEYAIDKGTPVIEKSANAIKGKVIEVSEQVIEKLSDGKKTK